MTEEELQKAVHSLNTLLGTLIAGNIKVMGELVALKNLYADLHSQGSPEEKTRIMAMLERNSKVCSQAVWEAMEAANPSITALLDDRSLKDILPDDE